MFGFNFGLIGLRKFDISISSEFKYVNEWLDC